MHAFCPTAHLNRIKIILAKRNLECLSTESLFVMAATVRAQLRRLTAAPVAMHTAADVTVTPALAQTSTPLAPFTHGGAE